MCDRKKCEYVYDKMEEAKEKTEKVIREHPLASVAIAAGVGAVAGVVVSEGIRAIIRRR
jgi:ElaB/YqjD/DUF883 family membrane-anchored ribosome-binding protein